MKDPVTGKPAPFEVQVAATPGGRPFTARATGGQDDGMDALLSAFTKAFFIAAAIKLAVFLFQYWYPSSD
jgi:hypothetical protein